MVGKKETHIHNLQFAFMFMFVFVFVFMFMFMFMFMFRFRFRFSYSSGDLKGVTYTICVVNNSTCVCMHRTLFVSYTQSVSYRSHTVTCFNCCRIYNQVCCIFHSVDSKASCPNLVMYMHILKRYWSVPV